MTSKGASSSRSDAPLLRGQTPKGIKIRIDRKRDQSRSFHAQDAEVSLNQGLSTMEECVCLAC